MHDPRGSLSYLSYESRALSYEGPRKGTPSGAGRAQYSITMHSSPAQSDPFHFRDRNTNRQKAKGSTDSALLSKPTDRTPIRKRERPSRPKNSRSWAQVHVPRKPKSLSVCFFLIFKSRAPRTRGRGRSRLREGTTRGARPATDDARQQLHPHRGPLRTGDSKTGAQRVFAF